MLSVLNNYEVYVSIIVPMYNSEKYIENLIEMLEKQTYKNFEVILIDDGSKDKTYEKCKKFIENHNNFYLLHHENHGVSFTRNIGIDAAKGKYIVFVDADDYIYENMIELLVRNIEESKSDFAFGGYITNKNKKVRTTENTISEDIKKLKLSIMNERYFNSRGKYQNPRTVWGKIYKKSIIEKYNIRFENNIKLFEDGLFNIDYISNIKKYSSFSNVIYKYTIERNSSVSKCRSDLYEQDKIRLSRLKEKIRIENYDDSECYKLLTFEFFCGYLINEMKKGSLGISRIKTLKTNSIYSDAIKKVDRKYLGRNHRIIYYLLKCRLYFLIKILTKLK